MQGWDFNASTSTKEKTSFTKFEVGVTNIRLIDLAPMVRWTHWLPQYKKSVNCPGRGCPIDDIRNRQKANKEPQTYNMSRRIAINVFNYNTNQVEIMEQGVTFFEDLRTLLEEAKEEGFKPDQVIFKVRRRGTGKDDTSYRIDIDRFDVPNEDEVEVYTKGKVDLKEYFKPHTPEQILQLIQFTAPTFEEYREHWNKVMQYGETESTDGNEELEIK